MERVVRSPDVSRGYARLPWVGAAILGLVGVSLVTSWLVGGRAGSARAEAASATGRDPSAGAALRTPLAAAVARFLDAPVTLRFDGKEFRTTWKELGLTADPAGLDRQAAALADTAASDVTADWYLSGQHAPVPVILDRPKALEALVAYKDSYDRPAQDARLDLDNRRVIPEQRGYGMHVYASMTVLESTARAGAASVDLPGGEVVPNLTREKLGNIDISNVMGWFETSYPVGERDRNHNLKLAAEKVNGHVIMPGELFSFNEVVGERTEKQGYRVAHVIQAGEMIDGLAGGACQVSSTLHGAAFFAGLEIVFSRPHSRPSAYVTMGMDATVVYPSTDLKLRNPYDFPVAIRYIVSQGTMRVEVLGKGRPYDKITFEREIEKEIPYETITREDDSMPVGSQIVEQVGFPGYELWRRRVYWKDGKKVKVEKWRVKYPPTTEYLRVGTNPDPNLAPPKQPKLHGPMNPGGKHYALSQ